jgi:hypothetical protein
MRRAQGSRHSRCTIALLASLLVGCDSPAILDPPRVAPLLHSLAASPDDPRDAVLFIGNLVTGGIGNGILRYDGSGNFIDAFTPGNCCMTFGPGEHLYVTRQGGIHRFNGVTGEFMGVFVAPDPNPAIIAFIPVLGPDGYLYVSYRGAAGQSIRRYDASGNVDDAFFVDGRAQGVTGSQFFGFGPDGNLYFTSGGTHEVLRFSGRGGAFIDGFVEAGEGGLVEPSGLTFGPDGILYVGSPSTDRVLRFDRDGAYIGDFFPAGSGGLDLPVGFTFGPDGNFYVAGAATPQAAGVFRYNGTSGEFMDTFVGPGDGRTTGPRTLHFKTKIAMCHVPRGNPDDKRTITIGYLFARDHVDHGDAVGPCAS